MKKKICALHFLVSIVFFVTSCSENLQSSETLEASPIILDSSGTDQAGQNPSDGSDDGSSSGTGGNGSSGTGGNGSSGTGGSNTGGSGSNHATYPLPQNPLFTGEDYSNQTLEPGETANATPGIISSTEYHENLYFFIKRLSVELEIDKVKQPSQDFVVNKYFPKTNYVTAAKNRVQTISSAGDIGNFQRIFYFQCDTSKGRYYSVDMKIDYTREISDGFGNLIKTEVNDKQVALGYLCDGSANTNFYVNFNL